MFTTKHEKVFFILAGITISVFILLNVESHPISFLNTKKEKFKGDFNGDGKKEEIKYSTKEKDVGCITKIQFLGKSDLISIIDTGQSVSYIRNEGNLDRFPGDEVTIYKSSCEAGEWIEGVLYGFRNGKWKVHSSFPIYGSPWDYDYVTKDPAGDNVIFIEENAWEGKTMTLSKKRVILD